MQTLETIQTYKKEILIGRTKDSAISLELRIDEKNELSMSGSDYDIDNVISESEGEQRAQEYLDDGESWKLAVEAGDTTQSEEDFNESVLNIDGWQHVIGDIYEIAYDKYVSLQSCGQIDMHLKATDFVETDINTEELKLIFSAWKVLHLKTCFGKGKYTKKDYSIVDQVKAIFEKMPAFDVEQMGKYVEDE